MPSISTTAPVGEQRVPYYMYRKLVEYLAQAFAARGVSERRFYFVRLAAAVGEMNGAWRRNHR